MTRRSLGECTASELVEKFVELTLAQDVAVSRGQNAKYNRLYDQVDAVTEELKSRDGDQRRELITLFAHPNPHVRLQSAKWTLAVEPAAAREQLTVIAGSHFFPAAG